MIQVECPHCGVIMSVDEQYVGKKGRCDRCKNIVTIPDRIPDARPPAGAAGGYDMSVHEAPLPLDLEFDSNGGDPFADNPFDRVCSPGSGSSESSGSISAMFAQADGRSASGYVPIANPFGGSGEEAAVANQAGQVGDAPADQARTGAPGPTSAQQDSRRGETRAASEGGAGGENALGDPQPVFAQARASEEKVRKEYKIRCPHCGTGSRVSPRHIGRKGRCQRCRAVFQISKTADGEVSVTLVESPNQPVAKPESPQAGRDRKPVDERAAQRNQAMPQDTRAVQATGFGGSAEPGLPETVSAKGTSVGSVPAAAMRQTASLGTSPLARSPSDFAQIKIEAVEAILVNLPCTGTFILAGGTYATKGAPTPRVLVKVVGSNGVVGWGEVTPCPTWCYETSETIVSTIRTYLAPALVGLNGWDRDLVVRTMERVIQPGATIGQPLAKSGVDTALHDLLARSLEVPLHVLFGSKRRDDIWLSYIVSGHSVEQALPQVREGLERGYCAFKIKVGMNDESVDREIIQSVAECVPKGTYLWVDANQGYGLDAAMRQARHMGRLGVQVLEQPIKGARISAFRQLVALGAVPIAVDETVCSATDLIEYIRADAVDLPIAKVQRCGGHYHSIRFCAVAEAAGLRLMGSGLCETDLGLAHGIQLFSAFGIDLPCDLNGRQFVDSCYLRETVTVSNGRVAIPDRPGCGVEVDEDKVSEFAVVF